MPGSPAAAPANRNCSATVVFPVPGLPSNKCKRLRASPPPRTASSPLTPVDARGNLLLLSIAQKIYYFPTKFPTLSARPSSLRLLAHSLPGNDCRTARGSLVVSGGRV